VSRDDRENSGYSDDSWAPQEIFQSILAYSVVPTFDLILKGVDGVLLVKRRIAPYQGLWALPGLRILRSESIPECLERIACMEVGLRLDPSLAVYVNQALAEFDTRKDLSTCYAFELDIERINLNEDHLSDWMFIKDLANAPASMGELYREHLHRYFAVVGGT
jgi:ADP-ribose pyrophosphatase YjhB (NUDIX family)